MESKIRRYIENLLSRVSTLGFVNSTICVLMACIDCDKSAECVTAAIALYWLSMLLKMLGR